MSQPSFDTPLEVQVAVLCTKLDTLIEQLADHEPRIRELEKVSDPTHKQRIRNLENFKWILFGAAASSYPIFQGIQAQF